ncbi:MAG: alpha/beta hydrolase [Anaerolineae bacterium]
MPYANNNGIRIHYETEGEGPPLVLLHSFPGWLESFYESGHVEALRDDYRLALVDLRGFGGSDKPHDVQSYGLRSLASDVVAVLDDLGIDRAHCWGYVFGARVAWGLARFYPERCRSLVIGADYPFELDPTQPLPAWESGIIEVLKQGQAAWVTAMMGMFSRWAQPGWDLPAIEARVACDDVEALLALRSNRECVGLLEALDGLAVPCLLYAGEMDPNYANLQGLAQHLANATFVGLPGLNHMQAAFALDTILPHVRAFLAGVEGRQ